MSEGKVVKLKTQKRKKGMSFLYTLFALLIIAVFLYQVFKINYDPVKTEIALKNTISDHVDTKAFIVRDEMPIKASASGTLVPLVEDGKRVANGDDVAVVFTSEAAAKVYNELSSVKEDIAYFSSLQNKVGIQTTDVDTLDDRIYAACEAYVLALDSGVVENYGGYEDTIRDTITSRQLSTGTEINPSEKLAGLKARLADLQAQEGGYTTIKADSPGYYISHVDGYEGAVQYDDILSLTTAQITALLDGSAAPSDNTTGYMGKLVDGFNWYMLCVLNYENVAGLKVGGSLTVEFTGSTAEPVKAQVLKINDTADGKASVILKCNLMNTKYAGLRLEQVRLIFSEYVGYEVNNKAIREVDGQKGVYVLNGNIVTFKKINILYADSAYSVCAAPEGSSGYLKLYDEIIVEGTDLYDGKILG